MSSNAEIIEAAMLGLAAYSLTEEPAKGSADADLIARLEAAIKPMESGDIVLVMMAVKLLGGGQYGVSTDNPENARRVRSIATDLGATVDFVEMHEGQTVMQFTPPLRS
jgi:hypothetical protein